MNLSVSYSQLRKPFLLPRQADWPMWQEPFPNSFNPLGCEVKLVMPYYRMVKKSGFPLQYLGEEIEVPLGEEIISADLYQGQLTENSRSISSAVKSFSTGNTSMAPQRGLL